VSTCISKEIVCAKCSAKQKLQAWPSATVLQNPELRKKVLDETLFNWTCEKCGYQALVVYPFLYHDTQRRLMIALNPDPDAKRLESPPLVDGLKKRVVRLPAELKEKILIFEAGLDDAAMELTKLLLSAPLCKKYGTEKLRMYFCRRDDNGMVFAVFTAGNPEPTYESAAQKIYDQCLGVAREFEFDTTAFAAVDADFAQRMLDDYQQFE
jgi:hypothetical protein